MVSTRAPVGYVALAKNQLATNQGFRSLVLPDHVPAFFFYVLRASRATLESRANGSTFKELSGRELKRVEVPVPPRATQAAHAFRLNTLDDKAAICAASASSVLRLADAIFARAMASCTDRVEIGGLAEICGGSTPSTKVEAYWGGPHLWATPSDVTALEQPYLETTGRTLTDEGLAAASLRIHQPGAILLTSRATVGEVALLEAPCATNQGFIAMATSQREYTWLLFHELRARRAEIERMANGSTFPELSKADFRSWKVRWPEHQKLTALGQQLETLHGYARDAERDAARFVKLRDNFAAALLG